MPAYGIAIEVETDLADGNGGGMAAVARWTAEGESRRRHLQAKLRPWAKVCPFVHEDLHENNLVLCSSAMLLHASHPFRLQISPFWLATHPNSLSNQPLRRHQNLLTSIRSLRYGLQGNLLFPFPSSHRHHPHRQTKET